jgi:hypothetical protein
MDLLRASDILQTQVQVQLPIELAGDFLSRDSVAVGLALDFEGTDLAIQGLLACEPGSLDAYGSAEPSADILGRFPENPVFCLSVNTDGARVWADLRGGLDKLFSAVAGHAGSMLGDLPKNTAEGLERLEGFLRDKLDVEADLESEFFANFRGNAALAVYALPSAPDAGLKATAAFSLRDPKTGASLLDRFMRALEAQGIGLSREVFAEGEFFSMDSGPAAGAMIGVRSDCLVLSTQGEAFLGESGSASLLSSLPDREVADAMNSGAFAAGYWDGKRTVEQGRAIVPGETPEWIASLRDLGWIVRIVPDGFEIRAKLRSTEPILPRILRETESAARRMREERELLENAAGE